MSKALIYVEEILSYREITLARIKPVPGTEGIFEDPFDVTRRTFEIYLTCYQVLKAAGDPRAGDILHSAYTLLMERAERIEDQQIRDSFLKNVRSNREIAEAWDFHKAKHPDG